MTYTRQILRATVIGFCLLSLVACSDLDTTQQRTLSGGAIGAGVGTGVTLITGGCVACGAAIGGVAGAAGGYIYDQIEKDKNTGSSVGYQTAPSNTPPAAAGSQQPAGTNLPSTTTPAQPAS